MSDSERAIAAAKSFAHEASNFRVANQHSDFLDGSLYLINFEDKKGNTHCYVYIEGNYIEVCNNQALLNEFVARKSKKIGLAATLNSLGGIAGIIGLIIILTIVFLVIRDPKAEVPQILSAALTAILAFYFGSKVSKN